MTTSDQDAGTPAGPRPDPAHADPVQDELPFDEPVPFRLTVHGRRAVAPDDEPALRVVPRAGAGTGPARDDGRPVALDDADGAVRARARAMRRGGMHTLDIADRLGVEPLHIERWTGDLPVPAARRRLRAVPSLGHDPSTPTVAADADPATSGRVAAGVAARWRTARDEGRAEAEQRLVAEPALRSGLGLVAGLLEPDHHALLLTGDELALVAPAWRWVLHALGGGDAPARVLARHDPAVAADTVGHAVAGALALSVDAVTTSRDPSRTGRTPALRLRVADPVLAGRVAGWRRALLAEVGGDDQGQPVGA